MLFTVAKQSGNMPRHSTSKSSPRKSCSLGSNTLLTTSKHWHPCKPPRTAHLTDVSNSRPHTAGKSAGFSTQQYSRRIPLPKAYGRIQPVLFIAFVGCAVQHPRPSGKKKRAFARFFSYLSKTSLFR